MPADKQCTVIVETGITTSAMVQNGSNFTITATLASNPDIGPALLESAPAIELPTFRISNLTLTNATTSTATSLSFEFQLNVILNVADTMTLTLPSYTFGVLAVPNVTGCGGTTFVVVSNASGTMWAALIFTAGNLIRTLLSSPSPLV